MKTTDQRTTISPYLVLAEAPRGEDEEDVGEDAADAEGDGQAAERP